MLETPHALVGMVFVKYVPSPIAGVFLAFFSHFLVDMLPHWNWHPDTRPLSLLGMTVDLILAEILVLYLFSQGGGDFRLILGAAAAILPDLLEAPTVLWGYENRWVQRLISLQVRLQNNVAIIPGVLSQILLSAICFLLLAR